MSYYSPDSLKRTPNDLSIKTLELNLIDRLLESPTRDYLHATVISRQLNPNGRYDLKINLAYPIRSTFFQSGSPFFDSDWSGLKFTDCASIKMYMNTVARTQCDLMS